MTQETHDRRTVQHILITGASGGLGRALASNYAAPGVFLYLWGRNTERLAVTQRICKEKGAEAEFLIRDVRNMDEVRTTLSTLMYEHPLDLVFLNAGVASGSLSKDTMEPVEDACRTFEVNALDTINIAATLLPMMRQRGSGHIVFTSSIAGLYPIADAPAYSASKAAISYYAKATRSFLSDSPVRVSIVYPGYLKTEMGWRFHGPKPFMTEPDKAASIIRHHLNSGSDHIIFPRLMGLGMALLHLMPGRMADFFVKRFGFSVQPDHESPATYQVPK